MPITTPRRATDRPPVRLWRAIATLARRADTYLAQQAARNAAVMIESARTGRRLEEARALRDLRRLGLDDDAVATTPGEAASGRRG